MKNKFWKNNKKKTKNKHIKLENQTFANIAQLKKSAENIFKKIK